ncbi:MAG: HU family DNA-binding protein [Bacteroidaceae bacterium]
MNERISTTELADILARKAGLSQEEAFAFVRDVFDCIDRAISDDKYVKVKGLGTFKLISMSPRESVAVNTGERIVIEGYQKFSFTPEVALKDLINKPFAHFEAVPLNEGVEFNDTEVDFKDAEGDEDSSVDTADTDAEDSFTELVSRPMSTEDFYSSVEVIPVLPSTVATSSEPTPETPPAINPVNPMAARKKTTIFAVPVVDKTVPFDANVQPQPLVADVQPSEKEEVADEIPSKSEAEIPISSSSMEVEQEEDPKERLKKERSRAAAELLARLKAKQQLQKEEEMNRVRPLGRKKPESLSESTETQKESVERLPNSDMASSSDTAESLSQRIEGKLQEKNSFQNTAAVSKASSHLAEVISLRLGRSETVGKVEDTEGREEAEKPKTYSEEIIETEMLSSEKGTPEGLERAKERRERNEASLRASRKTYRFPFFIMTAVLLLVLFMISFVYITQPVWIQDIMGTKDQQIIIKLADQPETSVAPRKPVAQPVQTQKAEESKRESAIVPSKSNTPPAPSVKKAPPTAAQASDKLWITAAHVNPKDYKIVGTLESITLTSGMSLARLSKKYYGCRDLWALILAHNSATIKNADNIPLGMTLKIPKLMKK